MRDLREKDWFWLDNALIDRTDLNLYEKMLYACLARHTGKKEYAYPALETLARELGIKDTRTIVKYTKSLANKGLVVIEKLKGKSNRYYLKNVEKVPTLDVPSNKEVDTLEVPTSHVPTTPDVSTPPTSHVPSSTYMGCTPKKTNIKNTNKETTTKIDNINKIDPSSSSLEILEKDKIKQIKSALQMHGISVATCKNIMDLVYSKHIDLERIKAVLTVAVIKRWEDGAIYKALKENWIIENKKCDVLPVKTNTILEKKAKKVIEKNLEHKEQRDKTIEEKEKLRKIFETLSYHEKNSIEQESLKLALEKYNKNIAHIMARTETFFDVLKEYLRNKKMKEVI
ncbi:helix-turn-helix domain-containing protein [Fusobacterium varium]|uniref:helix-turn-helix domain-containing protein n=3 Tax=Fusobacterium TaxID=848 RepID=UPI001898C041|nr:helix-turn-helix domain-containing protein [Fusobacterium varium]